MLQYRREGKRCKKSILPYNTAIGANEMGATVVIVFVVVYWSRRVGDFGSVKMKKPAITSPYILVIGMCYGVYKRGLLMVVVV